MVNPLIRMAGFVWVVGIVLTGCAFDLMDVKYSPTKLQMPAPEEQSFMLEQDVQLNQAPCGYSRTLRQKSRWLLVGNVAEGNVFRSKDQVLTVECSNVFEAYLVVSGNRLVGFYLPVEKGFVALSTPVQLPLAQ